MNFALKCRCETEKPFIKANLQIQNASLLDCFDHFVVSQ
ncbi:hypothetical protein CAMGR0001_1996 [Campylobacter gracilis RM3268]|uniref:Uncharacterized protein n=1 Tax=Campylobacter gracilis RM3268 TaxID=553220 RepID=C8PLI7_9BACT|nr:hypothetical protein CAMGR0001_1996 [Campylobacter gracilis RM3268]